MDFQKILLHSVIKEKGPFMKYFLGLIGCLYLFGCSTSVKQYQNEKPILQLDSYLNGDLVAQGVFMDRWGTVKKRFVVDMKASWTPEGVGTLVEDFKWSDGTKTQRIWTLKKLADGKYEGTAADVDGKALGEAAGNAFNWAYTLNLDVDGTTWKVQFDDWMFLVDEKTLLNKAVMSKWGFRLGEVLISFQKK